MNYTPKQIVNELDKYIVGQAKAKRAVAVALRNRYRRAHLPTEIRDEITPKNIVMRGPTGVGKTEIAKGTEIKKDFDTNKLNGDCFGARKSTSNGTMVSVDGEYVKVWCNGVLDNPDEFLENGEITYGTQPTCSDLAEYGYVAIENNGCYGKYYDQSEYFIECDGNNLLPSRIILLNGADYNMPSGNFPADESAADKIFDQMETISETQRQKYFKKD